MQLPNLTVKKSALVSPNVLPIILVDDKNRKHCPNKCGQLVETIERKWICFNCNTEFNIIQQNA